MGARAAPKLAARCSWRCAGLLGLVGLLACQDAGAPAGARKDWPDASLAVGPAPLRRLSNQEYLNALADLFPGLELALLPALPDDGVVAGFENAIAGQTASDVRIARYEEIARLHARAATSDPAAFEALLGCAHRSADEQAACAVPFIERQGARLFRRPLDASEVDRFALRFERVRRALDFEAAVELTLGAMLQAPQFLYRAELPEPGDEAAVVEPYAMASRLSFLLWESVPDAPLYEAAARDELHSLEQLRDQAERMLRDPRARRALWDFHRQWLALDRVLGDEHSLRTPEVDPDWSVERQQSAARETRLFVEHVASEEGTLAALLTSRRAFVDEQMAALYGVAKPAGAAWSEVQLPADERAGLLTRAAFLVATSHRGATSPPVRANAINLRLLCRLPTEPPDDVDLTPPMPGEDDGPRTNRMLYEERTAPAVCQGCHLGLNGIGFGLEPYTAAGAYTERDQGLEVDARGRLYGTDVDGTFRGGVELSERLARSELVQRCAAQSWLRYALGRAPSADEAPFAEALGQQFVASGGDLAGLLVSIVTADTFRLRLPEEP